MAPNVLVDKLVKILRFHTGKYTPPLVNQIIEEFGHDPYLILMSCLISLRAKDMTTIHLCRALFAKIRTPQEMVELPLHELEKIIYKSGFYKTKARVLIEVSQRLLDDFNGKVPAIREQLLGIKGIGPKTAQLVLGLAFHEPSICVDTHVHRISNRLGLIKTKTPEKTEQALARCLDKKYWTIWNELLVMWGQNICVPISPKCSQCPINKLCGRVGVVKSR